MCAFVGQEWIKKRGTKIARISGLDPGKKIYLVKLIRFFLPRSK
jgi:hypothetical protein